jgi:hypothetical protein
MSPQETFEQSSSHIGEKTGLVGQLSMDEEPSYPADNDASGEKKLLLCGGAGLVIFLFFLRSASGSFAPTGPYELVELQEGEKFFDFYKFYDGPDSLGSGSYLSVLRVNL